VKLGSLLPIHAVRERRAQRLYYEQSQAHERAMSAQTNASAALVCLQNSHQAALANALEGSTMNAAHAQASLDQAAVALRGIAPAQKELSEKQAQTEQALAAAVESRVLYANKVRTHHKMRELCSLENSREAAVAQARCEIEADDEFVAPWLARQQRLTGVA
jgi:hypothetical protein